MANRDMTNQMYSFEKARKHVNARLSFGAAGAPTLDSARSKGILDVTRNSTGNYTFRFGVAVGSSLNTYDYYAKLLGLTYIPEVNYLTTAAPAAANMALYRGDLLSGANLSPPVQSAASQAGTGGLLLHSQAYYYKVTAVDSNGAESLASNEITITTAANGAADTLTVTVNWAVVPGAVKYRIYRGTSSGAQSVVYEKTDGAATSFVDTGAASQVSAASPTVQSRPPIATAAVTVQFLDYAGSAVDPASGEAALVKFEFGDSGAP